MKDNTVAIIGGGRLGTALARGFKNANLQHALHIAQRNPEKRDRLRAEGFRVEPSIKDFSHYEMIIIAVKLVDIDDVLANIARSASINTIIISAVVGVSGNELLYKLKTPYPVVRAMFSIFAENNQEIIPVFPCNDAARLALESKTWLLASLGKTEIVSEEFMQLSGWDLYSLPGLIVAQALMQRLSEINSMNLPMTEKRLSKQLLKVGIRGLEQYISTREKHQSLEEILNELHDRIATPGGRNEAMLKFLYGQGYLQLLDEAYVRYTKHRLTSNIIAAKFENPPPGTE